MMRLSCYLLLLALTVSVPAAAQQALVSHYVAGTGFVINNEGHVVTNAHVVKDCQSISILTAQTEQKAILVAADPKRDLAVLKTPYLTKTVAPLRWNISDLHVGDSVIVLGYPGSEGSAGRYVFKKTRLVSLKGMEGEPGSILLEGVTNYGNSGGPVLDTSGNVIAVIASKTLFYKRDDRGNLASEASGQLDNAIVLSALKDFLHEHAISFYQSTSDGHAYSDDTLRDNANNFTVSVRCVQGITTR